MLRLAISRAAPRRLAVLPSAVRWTRFNSTQSTPTPKAGKAAEKSQKKQKKQEANVSAKAASVNPEEVEDGVYELSEEERLTVEELEKELDDLNFGAPTFTGPEKVGETEEDLFGSSSSKSTSQVPEFESTFLDPKLMDPARLPLRGPVDPNAPEPEIAASLVHGRGIHQAYQHPKTHNIPVAVLHFRSHHVKLLDLFTHFALHAASSLGIPTSRVASLPTQRSLWTVLRSPFVHKKRQENFERKVHKRAIKAWDAPPEVVERWTKYLQRHAMGGVGLRVVKWERVPVSVGRLRSEEVDKQLEGLQPKEIPDREKIQRLGKKIVLEELNSISQGANTVTARS